MSHAHVLGFPRIGAHRELKFALETFWHDPHAALEPLLATAHTVRARNWAMQQTAGLDWVTVGDFAWYDHVLQTLVNLGACPSRFGFDGQPLSVRQNFEMARGNAAQAPMASAQWFDTNYHYLVPEFSPDTAFSGNADWLLEELDQALAAGHPVKPVLIGPVTLLWLGRECDGLAHRLALLPRALEAYRRVLATLSARGVDWVQIDEPIFALDLAPEWRAAAHIAYATLAEAGPRLLLATYFDDVLDHAALLKSLPVAGLHVDLVRAPQQLSAFLDGFPCDKVLSCGVVDGRNVWRHDLDATLAQLQAARAQLGARLWVASSCSLLHVPVDLDQEARLDPELRSWLAFAAQKLIEISVLKQALCAGRSVVAASFDAASQACRARRAASRIHSAHVQRKVAQIDADHVRRSASYAQRAELQQARFNLPLLPTTTLGALPQTAEIRRARAAFRQGHIGHLEYLEAMREQIRWAIDKQHAYGLDVLVHGEAERSDMVEYFGEQLWGYALTEYGWVQSEGAQCVKPPVIYGDVYALQPMTIGWSSYAQSLSDKPVKGMLSGPITLLQRSFVRDDQPRATTALQIALALRDEVAALEAAGIGMIQFDELAMCEGLPLKQRDRAAYLEWAVHAFKVASCGAGNATQIHVQMGGARLADMLPVIAALDADVISIVTADSNIELLDDVERFESTNGIGPGVCEVHTMDHSSREQIDRRIAIALRRIPAQRLWVNPDGGLKTRDWAQLDQALPQMVAAAARARAMLAG